MAFKRRSQLAGSTSVSRLACGLVAAVALAGPVLAQTATKPSSAKPATTKIAVPAEKMTTLQDALVAAYANNPALQAARATLRATDENVPAALAGWHPTVTLSGQAGPAFSNQINAPTGPLNERYRVRENRAEVIGTATLTQPIYRGGRTTAATNKAENQVMAQRAKLLAQEQQTFSDTIAAYVGVISAQQILALNMNNEQVLTKQLQATNDRFRVGEITRTDVAQAQAALAGAVATRETAEGNLQAARATYQRLVGELPGKLAEPQPLSLPTKSLEEAKALARTNNPNVVAALFQNASDKDNFDLQYANLMPQVALQATSSYNQNGSFKDVTSEGTTVLATVSVPLYQGGSEYAAIRQARQAEQSSSRLIDDARNTAVQQVIAAWETYQATKSTIESTRSQIKSDEVALEGVQREAIVGSRTTLDVLNAELLLLNARTTLVQNLATLVNNAYTVAGAVGRLTARDLQLNVPYYNETAYYEAVRNRWIGTGDFATEQPGR